LAAICSHFCSIKTFINIKNQSPLSSLLIIKIMSAKSRRVKVSQPGLHRLAHHESGWKWVNPTRLILWWAINFVTRLNPPRVGGLSGLAHQPT